MHSFIYYSKSLNLLKAILFLKNPLIYFIFWDIIYLFRNAFLLFLLTLLFEYPTCNVSLVSQPKSPSHQLETFHPFRPHLFHFPLFSFFSFLQKLLSKTYYNIPKKKYSCILLSIIHLVIHILTHLPTNFFIGLYRYISTSSITF